jgi:hypothetical protein
VPAVTEEAHLWSSVGRYLIFMESALPDIVRRLAEEIGPRSAASPEHHMRLIRAAQVVEGALEALGYPVQSQRYEARGRPVRNLEVTLPYQRPGAVLILGAHYDTARRSPGASDNATGVGVLVELARRLRGLTLPSPVRLVAFGTEEPPFTRSAQMGSMVYARRCREEQEPIGGMISLECLGHFGARGQKALHVVGNFASRRLTAQVTALLRDGAAGPVRPWVLPGFLPGVRSSDHASFWRAGYAAVMVTGGGPLRARHYHRKSDTLRHVDLRRAETVAAALAAGLPRLL